MTQRYFIFDDDHEAYRESVRAFVAKELLPHAEEWEQAEYFPDETFPRMGALDLFGNKFDEKYGGTGAGYLFEAVLVEEMSRCGSGGGRPRPGAPAQLPPPPVESVGNADTKHTRRR